MSKVGVELKQLMLESPRLSLAVAESISCGRVQSAIGAVSGASEFFLGGITAYTIDLKVDLLGVDRPAARRVNAVSASVAEQMARGVCIRLGSDIGVATTGYAEPPDADKVVSPFAWWALAHRARRGDKLVTLHSGRVECPGATRIEAQSFVAEAVIVELVEYLRGFRRGSRK
jgi:nicotinamide-nucleotide amidase